MSQDNSPKKEEDPKPKEQVPPKEKPKSGESVSERRARKRGYK